ncbi:hypothetical protein J4453_01435 [Candidatus Woesearchaeota archaeon]|nr:hypothetical protein [Candidatus Woesearchaeota archaeon]
MKASDVYVQSATPTVYIRYKGVWDMEDLYLTMVDYLRGRKFKFHEKIYKHKHPSPFGVERQYIWQAERKEEEYIEFVIDIYFHTYDAHDVEVVMKDGTSKTFTKGRIWMEFKGHVTYDHEKRWERSAFYAQLRNFYNKYIIKKRMDQIWWDRLWYREIYPLHDLVRRQLKMESEGYEHRYWTGVHR